MNHEIGYGSVSASPAPLSASIFRPETVAIRPEQILRVNGYRDISKVRPDIVKAAQELSAVAEKLIDAEVHYRRVPVMTIDEAGMTLAGGVRFSSAIFKRYAAGSAEALVFVLTTGNRLDTQVREHIERFELIEALFLESSGWMAVEATTRLFARHVKKRLTRENRTLGMRLGPGYSYRIGSRTVDWPLEQQREFFRLFDGFTIPVSIMESCAMKPKLSRSGFYGVLPTQAAS